MPATDSPAATGHAFVSHPDGERYCRGCELLEAPLTLEEHDAPCDGRRWEWRVDGVEATVGTVRRAYEAAGFLIAPGYGEAVTALVECENLDGLDTDEEFTITFRPIFDEDARP
jgi:hypothetical protein